MKKKYFPILLYCLIVLGSCEKGIAELDADPNTKTDVYVAGAEYNGVITVAKYWKNGTSVNLPYASKNVEAYSIYVSGNDVYVSGRVYPDNPVYPGESIAIYWKNGIAVNLSNGKLTTATSSITVSGNDVYVAGYGVIVYNNCPRCTPPMSFTRFAKYWKNGIPVNFSDTSIQSSIEDYATSIAFSRNDVYVAGVESPAFGFMKNTAKYWKNGQPVKLSSRESEASSIAVSGNDVYVAGLEDYKPTYWKNGIPVKLSDELGEANSIAISGSEVYVAVTENTATGSVAKYWKNGSLVSLSSKRSNATSIAVSGSDIYVAGYETTNMIAFAGYWKNGIRVNVSAGVNAARANAIFVVRR